MRDTPQVRVYSNADIPRSLLKEEFVFILTLAILPNLEKESFENYDEEKSKEMWYNNDTLVGEMR